LSPSLPLLRQRGFGLVFATDHAVPGLAPAPPSEPYAVRLHLGRLPVWLAGVPRVALHRAATPDASVAISGVGAGGALLVEYGDGTRFVVDSAGTEVWADWLPEATLEDTATYLLGPVAALVLRLRGLVPLHASGVMLGDGIVALAGPRGAGKSTLAAAFATAGRTVIADDVLAVELSGEDCLAHPAYPRIRLWNQSVAALFGRSEALPLLTPGWEKRYLPLPPAPFSSGPFSLRAIYLLEPRRASAHGDIRPLTAREGMLYLVGSTCAAFLPDRRTRAREFRLLGAMSARIPLRLVSPTADIGDLHRLRHAIETDALDV
jgi:hypothetical protein